jgi:hypothetical protein
MQGITLSAPTTSEDQEMEIAGISKDDITLALSKTLPSSALRQVILKKGCFGDYFFKIVFGVPTTKGAQQIVSLSLDNDELRTQIYGGEGGGRIVRKPNLEDRHEKYLCQVGVKVPFKKPKHERKFILGAIERFATNWVETLKTTENIFFKEEFEQMLSQ